MTTDTLEIAVSASTDATDIHGMTAFQITTESDEKIIRRLESEELEMIVRQELMELEANFMDKKSRHEEAQRIRREAEQMHDELIRVMQEIDVRSVAIQQKTKQVADALVRQGLPADPYDVAQQLKINERMRIKTPAELDAIAEQLQANDRFIAQVEATTDAQSFQKEDARKEIELTSTELRQAAVGPYCREDGTLDMGALAKSPHFNKIRALPGMTEEFAAAAAKAVGASPTPDKVIAIPGKYGIKLSPTR